jgi:hypothetical protein
MSKVVAATTDYYETFKELLTLLESYDGQMHDPPAAAPPTEIITMTSLKLTAPEGAVDTA